MWNIPLWSYHLHNVLNNSSLSPLVTDASLQIVLHLRRLCKVWVFCQTVPRCGWSVGQPFLWSGCIGVVTHLLLMQADRLTCLVGSWKKFRKIDLPAEKNTKSKTIIPALTLHNIWRGCQRTDDENNWKKIINWKTDEWRTSVWNLFLFFFNSRSSSFLKVRDKDKTRQKGFISAPSSSCCRPTYQAGADMEQHYFFFFLNCEQGGAADRILTDGAERLNGSHYGLGGSGFKK